MYSVSRKNIEKIDAPSMSPTTFPPASERLRKRRSGMSGACARRSVATNPARSTADPTNMAMVRGDVHEWSTVCTNAYTSSERPPVTSVAPRRSNARFPCSTRLSRRMRGASAIAAMPTGTLM